MTEHQRDLLELHIANVTLIHSVGIRFNVDCQILKVEKSIINPKVRNCSQNKKWFYLLRRQVNFYLPFAHHFFELNVYPNHLPLFCPLLFASCWPFPSLFWVFVFSVVELRVPFAHDDHNWRPICVCCSVDNQFECDICDDSSINVNFDILYYKWHNQMQNRQLDAEGVIDECDTSICLNLRNTLNMLHIYEVKFGRINRKDD